MVYSLRIESLSPLVKELITYYFKRLEEEHIGCISAFALMGSIGQDDFIEGKSDIDFCAATYGKVSNSDAEKLMLIHTEIHKKFPTHFDGFYIRNELLSNPMLEDKNCYVVFPKRFYVGERPGSYPSYYYQLKYASHIVLGVLPEIHMPFKEVMAQQYEFMNTLWPAWLKGYELPRIKGFKLLYDTAVSEFGILNAGRGIYMLRTGNFVSKTKVGEYLLHDFPEHSDIIKEALATRKKLKPVKKISLSRYLKTRKLIGLIVKTFNSEYEKFQVSKS